MKITEFYQDLQRKTEEEQQKRWAVMNEMQEYADNLWIGSYQCASDRDTLLSHNITHVVAVGTGLKEEHPEDFRYHVVEVEDYPDSDLFTHLEQGVEFIEGALKEGGVVYVHCWAGISRSSTMAIAHLIKCQQMTLDFALEQIKNVRPCVQPNRGFMEQLKRWEEISNS